MSVLSGVSVPQGQQTPQTPTFLIGEGSPREPSNWLVIRASRIVAVFAWFAWSGSGWRVTVRLCIHLHQGADIIVDLPVEMNLDFYCSVDLRQCSCIPTLDYLQ